MTESIDPIRKASEIAQAVVREDFPAIESMREKLDHCAQLALDFELEALNQNWDESKADQHWAMVTLTQCREQACELRKALENRRVELSSPQSLVQVL